jgi:molecular chaperone DnaK (HSP70)
MDYLVGTAAVEAEPYNPAATIRCVKRALGTSKSYNINGCSVDTELATSVILRSLRRNAEEALGTLVSRCIASHPVNGSGYPALERFAVRPWLPHPQDS